METDNLKLRSIITENVRQGNFIKRRHKSLDNFELVPAVARGQ